jgi:intracellular septation protein A
MGSKVIETVFGFALAAATVVLKLKVDISDWLFALLMLIAGFNISKSQMKDAVASLVELIRARGGGGAS